MPVRRPAVPGIALIALAWIATGVVAATWPATADGRLQFRVRLPPDAARAVEALGLETPIDGRLYVVVSRRGSPEPREQVGVTGVPFWGVDVQRLAGGGTVLVTGVEPGFAGYPLETLGELPAGTYYAQALLNVYTTFPRSDGHTVQLHLDAGEGQDPWRAPGNVVSRVQRIETGAAGNGTVELVLDTVMPPIEPPGPGAVLQQGNPPDRELVEFVKIESAVLSRFWGRPMYLGANVLLPRSYAGAPTRRYPVLYLQGHFPGRAAPFDYGDDGRGDRGRGFTEFWNGSTAPELIIVTFRDANPYYDTSYSVDSANVGPYGTALTTELIPEIERRFRTIDEPWARLLAGGSTGGWEALALQIHHPDLFGGTWAWCPDSVDFRYHQIVNIYEDANAYYLEEEWHRVERPNHRRPDGNVLSTVRMENLMERAVGSRGRSAGQWAIWEAVFGPVAPDGYPRPLWDPLTGAIDRETAEYWRTHADLRHHLATNWTSLGHRLAGKIHVATGDMDSYYLEQAVYLLQEFLDATEDPPAEATFAYGRRQPHCWIGESPGRPGRQMTNAEFVAMVGAFLREGGPAAPAGGAR